MADRSRSKAHISGNPAKAAQAEAARHPVRQGGGISVVRTGVAALIGLVGIAWMVVYLNVAKDGKQLTWMGDLGLWNFLIGFGLLFVGMALLANPRTPLGRGRGVVVGMLGCFLFGLIWIVVYYMAGQPSTLPVFSDLEAYNLLVGIGFMAVGFVYATRWE